MVNGNKKDLIKIIMLSSAYYYQQRYFLDKIGMDKPSVEAIALLEKNRRFHEFLLYDYLLNTTPGLSLLTNPFPQGALASSEELEAIAETYDQFVEIHIRENIIDKSSFDKQLFEVLGKIVEQRKTKE